MRCGKNGTCLAGPDEAVLQEYNKVAHFAGCLRYTERLNEKTTEQI